MEAPYPYPLSARHSRCKSFSFSAPFSQCHGRFVQLLTSHFVCTKYGVPIAFEMFTGAKLSDVCSVRADWLCMGWPFCMAEMRREFQTGGNFFCTTLYVYGNSLDLRSDIDLDESSNSKLFKARKATGSATATKPFFPSR